MATISSFWLVRTASQATSPYSSVSRGVIFLAVRVTRMESPGGHGGDEAQVLQAVVGQHRARRGLDEQPGGPGQQQVAVRHDAREERVGRGGFLVGVGVEGVAGGVREWVMSSRVTSRRSERHGVADVQRGQGLPERVLALGLEREVAVRPGVPDAR